MLSPIKQLFLLCLAASFAQVVLAQETVAFYFAAHEDDWQLFMSPNAYRDAQSSSTKVVFVYLTAGDGGAGVGNAGRSQPYYLARENGAKLSAMLIANAANNPVTPTGSEASIAGHTVTRWIYGRTVSYFFRLPDGNMDGAGYDSTGLQSLRRLHEGALASMTAVDSSATYRDWADLMRTLRDLIDRERGQASTVWVNVPDTDVTKNPGDHSDHQQMAGGVLEAIRGLSCIGTTFYLDYVLATLDENASSQDRDIKAAAFAATAVGLNMMDHPSNWDQQHRSLLGRHSFRTVPGTGHCAK